MGYHTFDVDRAEELERPDRYRLVSAEELVGPLVETGADLVADLGSGTGFYTDVVAPHVGALRAVDVQPAMHDRYREKGVPEGVDLVTARIDDLPFPDDDLDAALSTMTYHEFAGEAALAELARVVRPGGRVVTVDWSADGDGAAGPPTDERYALGDAVSAFADAGFRTTRAETRRETFLHVARPD